MTIASDSPEPASDATTPELGRTRQQTRAQQFIDTLRNLTPLSPQRTETIIFTDNEQQNTPSEQKVDESEEGSNSPIDDVGQSRDRTNSNEHTGLDRENITSILEDHIRASVTEANENLDEADEADDGAIAADLVDKARQLLEEGINKSSNSSRKLQNWISNIASNFHDQLFELPKSTYVTEATHRLEELIDDAYQIHDEWLNNEITERIKREKEALKRLRKRRKQGAK
jgi:hypothetical protein